MSDAEIQIGDVIVEVTISGGEGPAGTITPEMTALAEAADADRVAAEAARDAAAASAAAAADGAFALFTVATLPPATDPRLIWVSDALNDAGNDSGVLAFADGARWRTAGGKIVKVKPLVPDSNTPTEFTDTAVNIDAGGHFTTSPFARTIYTTSATSITIHGFTSAFDLFPTYAELGLVVDGEYLTSVAATASGAFSQTIALAPGAKTIEIINGLTSRPSDAVGLIGTVLVTIDANDTLTRVIPAAAPRTVFLVDSIGAGSDALPPTRRAYISWLRSASSDSIVAHGWGYNSLNFMAGDSTKRDALVAQLVALNPARIVNTLGTNDYGYVQTTAAAFQTAYAALNDAIHSALPSASVIAVKPIVRATETANTAGSTLPQFRSAIDAAATGKTWVTVVDGSTFMTTAEIPDGVHPSTYGHWKWAQGISSALGYTVPPYTANPMTEEDSNGSVTSLGSGVYRIQKVGGGTGFNCGFAGQPQTGDFRYSFDVQNAQETMIGLNVSPFSSSGYSDMSAQVYITGANVTGANGILLYNGGVEGATLPYTYLAGDRFWIDRNGSTVTQRLGQNFAEARIIRTDTVSGTISLDISMYTVGAQIDVTPNAGAGTAIVNVPMKAGPDAENGTVTALSGNVSRLTKTGGGDAFATGGFYGPNRNGDFRYSVTVPALCQTFIGVDALADQGTIYTSMDHTIYLQTSGAIDVLDGSTEAGTAFTYAAGDVFWIDRTGSTVTWKKGATYSSATTIRTATASGGIALDIQIFAVGTVLDVVPVA